MTTVSNATAERIVAGTWKLLARHGLKRLSMREVAAAAGISRATLYEYFGTKQVLLRAIATRVEDEIQSAVVDAVAAQPDLAVRVEVVILAMFRFGTAHPDALKVLNVEPEFSINSIHHAFPAFLEVVEPLLVPALELAPSVQSGAMSPGALAELLLRVAATTFFVSTDDPDGMARSIAAWPLLHGSPSS
ncbi:TetR/AcrR family transcriptional regulator [Mycolicibacterium porcinum]|uniref:TetR/AcrR family transcriptional regulator n=1 Tax=Mycolicibacterium porcinum TaxID=39693 RepID=A0AAW5SZ36_9MYCO|nr:TetR/AcrR family transcriptional regulator [Mycolicibacterium porcinum]MCV7388081.1 TetR/AcrR family transcriptional regulator [Mycolicibacterium porcinum]ORB43393.1 TetR family transcriptional regulator [Mycolicibacterium porcinum]CDO31234.1 TetR family transcriptional regulator [Mycolicibacterium vulneris]